MEAKRITLIIFLWVLLNSETRAQFHLFKSINRVEIAAGPNSVSLYSNTIDGKDLTRQTKIAYQLKIGLVYDISERFSINTNFQFERKGLKSKLKLSYYDPSIDSTGCICTYKSGTILNNSNLDYLTFSFLLRYNMKNLPFYFSVGPYVSYLVQAKARQEFLWNGYVNYVHGKDNLNDLDGGLSVVLGYSVKLKNMHYLVFELHESYGILNITNQEVSETNATTNSFSFLLGLSFSQ